LKEEVNFRWARIITFLITTYLLIYFNPLAWFAPLKWLFSIIIAAIVVFLFPILSAPISLVVAPVFLLVVYIIPKIVNRLWIIIEKIFKVYSILTNKLLLQTSFVGFYTLIFYTLVDIWNFAYWRAFFISLIPAIILSDRVDRLFISRDILSKDTKSLFGIVYVLIVIVLKRIFNFTWVISYWLSIPLSILLAISFWKIFYKLVKPTRKS